MPGHLKLAHASGKTARKSTSRKGNEFFIGIEEVTDGQRRQYIHMARLHDSFYIRKSDCDGDVANLTVKEFNIRRVSPHR